MRTSFVEIVDIAVVVAPISGPRTTPSRIAKRPCERVNSTRMRENRTPGLRAARPLGDRSGRDPIERGFAAHREVANIQDAVLRRLRVGARRIHRHPHLAAIDLRIGVGEAEQRAGVGGLDIDHVAAAAGGPQIAVERRVAAELRGQRKLLIVPPRRDIRSSRPRNVSPLKPATVPSLHIEIEIGHAAWHLLACLAGGPAID